MKTLQLTIKKKWFDMIASGEKKEEYREIKQYWCNRLLWHEHHTEVGCIESLKQALEHDSERGWLSDGVFTTFYDSVTFRNGYRKTSPKITLELKIITHGKARPEWSDNWEGDVFILKLGDIINA